MPRVKIKCKDYKVKDIGAWIMWQMKSKKLTQASLAAYLNITQQALSLKISKGQFSYADLLTILNVLEATDEEIIKLMKL